MAELPSWAGRIVIDANNPIEAPLFKPVDLKGRVSSEVFADLVPEARVVKAFNHLRAEVLASDPKADGGRRVLFYRGEGRSRGHHRPDRVRRYRPLDRWQSAASSLSFLADRCQI